VALIFVNALSLKINCFGNQAAIKDLIKESLYFRLKYGLHNDKYKQFLPHKNCELRASIRNKIIIDH